MLRVLRLCCLKLRACFCWVTFSQWILFLSDCRKPFSHLFWTFGLALMVSLGFDKPNLALILLSSFSSLLFYTCNLITCSFAFSMISSRDCFCCWMASWLSSILSSSLSWASCWWMRDAICLPVFFLRYYSSWRFLSLWKSVCAKSMALFMLSKNFFMSFFSYCKNLATKAHDFGFSRETLILLVPS